MHIAKLIVAILLTQLLVACSMLHGDVKKQDPVAMDASAQLSEDMAALMLSGMTYTGIACTDKLILDAYIDTYKTYGTEASQQFIEEIANSKTIDCAMVQNVKMTIDPTQHVKTIQFGQSTRTYLTILNVHILWEGHVMNVYIVVRKTSSVI